MDCVAEAEVKFALCETCSERQGQNMLLGVSDQNCYICRGLTSRVDSLAKQVVLEARKYQFRTFSIGLILPSGVQEREDELRSEFKIRGGETIKAQTSRRISEIASRMLHKRVERLNPELTVLVDMKEGMVRASSKSLFAHCKYSKPRGLAQRRRFCTHCGGRGCERCDSSGYDRVPSVEEAIDTRLRKALKANRVKITWFGTEDDESVVSSPGRPFVVEVKSPALRVLPRSMAIRTVKGMVKVRSLGVLRGKPTRFPRFYFKTCALINPNQKVSPKELRMVEKKMRRVTVEYRNNKGKVVYKKVRSLRVRHSKGLLKAVIVLDGGLPVRRLITGESVSPSLAELLRTSLSCQRFDILRVWESGGFEFG
jgi:tRNA pseudouridine synthase 10